MTTLTDLDRAILDLERKPWRFTGSKEEAIRVELGMTSTRYYQRLNQLIDDPAALALDPVLIRRLRRIRARRQAPRTAMAERRRAG